MCCCAGNLCNVSTLPERLALFLCYLPFQKQEEDWSRNVLANFFSCPQKPSQKSLRNLTHPSFPLVRETVNFVFPRVLGRVVQSWVKITQGQCVHRESCPTKCFRVKQKESRTEIEPQVSANRPSNNWTLVTCLCFPGQSRGNHQDLHENKTNWFPEGLSFECFPSFLDFHFNSYKE